MQRIMPEHGAAGLARYNVQSDLDATAMEGRVEVFPVGLFTSVPHHDHQGKRRRIRDNDDRTQLE